MSISCLLVSIRSARLDGLLLAPADAPEWTPFGSGGTRLDLDKAWDGLRRLFDGYVWNERQPLADAVVGGTPLDAAADALEYGYGPPRYFRAAEVRDIAAALAAVDRDRMMSRCDPAGWEAANVYPPGWVDREAAGPPAAEWLGGAFDRLTAFYRRAADRELAVLLHFV